MPDNVVVIDPESIIIENYRLVKGQIDTPENFEIEGIKEFDVENSLAIKYNLDKNLIRTDFNIDIKTRTSETSTSQASGSFHFIFIFKVENLEEFIKVKPEKNVLDIRLAVMVAQVAYSTSRGILLTRMQGTAFQNFMLPIIDPAKLLLKK